MSHSINLPVDTLPSKGYGYSFNTLTIPQMVFSKILNYQADLEACNNALSTFLVQLRHILLPLEHGSEISIYDAVPLLAIRVYNSTAEQLTDYLKIRYHCPVHDREETMEVKLANFHFEDMNELLTKIDRVKINSHEYKFKIPTIGEFLKICETFKLRVPVQDSIKYMYLLSIFEEAYDPKSYNMLLADLLGATSKDIVTLNKLYTLITGAFTGFTATCTNEEEPVTVRIESISPVTDIFQNILETEELDQTAFSFK